MANILDGEQNYVVRTANSDDAESIFELVNAAYAIEMGESGISFKKENRYSTKDQALSDILCEKGVYFCLTRNGTICGCVRVYERVYNEELCIDIGPFAVDPAFQSKGIGNALLNKATDWAREKNIGKIVIEVVNHRTDLFTADEVQVDGSNIKKGSGFYGSRGFVLVDDTECDAAHNCDESKLTRPSRFLVLMKEIPHKQGKLDRRYN